ncbi:MAG TPA: nuclear transport factor 2 family protein [Caulobacteraceae bacterium]|jgi:ketosteroid isomerase-like protein
MNMRSPQECTAEFTAALIRQDIDASLSLIAEDVVFFYSNGAFLQGKDAFASMMTSSWKLVSDYNYSSSASTWIAESETFAAVIYRFSWSGEVRGEGVGGAGRGTRILRRDPHRGWLIAHEHLSSGQFPE